MSSCLEHYPFLNFIFIYFNLYLNVLLNNPRFISIFLLNFKWTITFVVEFYKMLLKGASNLILPPAGWGEGSYFLF